VCIYYRFEIGKQTPPTLFDRIGCVGVQSSGDDDVLPLDALRSFANSELTGDCLKYSQLIEDCLEININFKCVK
jgi:hypothetical protein